MTSSKSLNILQMMSTLQSVFNLGCHLQMWRLLQWCGTLDNALLWESTVNQGVCVVKTMVCDGPAAQSKVRECLQQWPGCPSDCGGGVRRRGWEETWGPGRGEAFHSPSLLLHPCGLAALNNAGLKFSAHIVTTIRERAHCEISLWAARYICAEYKIPFRQANLWKHKNVSRLKLLILLDCWRGPACVRIPWCIFWKKSSLLKIFSRSPVCVCSHVYKHVYVFRSVF